MLKFIGLILILSTQLFAQCDLTLFESTPTLNGGRVKPLFVQAKESIKFITGMSKIDGKSSTELYCLMTLNNTNVSKSIKLPILVEHREAKELLNLDKDKIQFEASTLIAQHDFIRAKVVQMKQTTPLKKELTKVWSRINRYKAIESGEDLTIYNKGEWKRFSEFKSDINKHADFDKLLLTSKEDYIKDNGDTYLTELTLFKSHIFSISMLFVLISIFATVLSKKLVFGVSFASLALVLQIIGMTMRVIVSGRAPITNMYETVMFSGFGALVISLAIMYFKKDRLFLLAGLGYNILCLFMMRFANNMLDESISPLVPVLRDNFWLSTHVTTIILSYAALALSWLLANIVLFKASKGSIIKSEQKYYENLINVCVIVGVTLLSAGIILGGVWADYSWGRFWGWDPKETWSLIVFLFYITLLHGRYTNWLNPKRYILSVAGGFMTVMMAWFGVNYILASGLHSYGFSEGGAIFLGSFFFIQTVFLVFTGLKYASETQTANA